MAEKHGLEVGVLGVVQDGLDVLDESHVEHLVSLVEHPEPEFLEGERLAVEVVLDAARGADDDVAALPQRALLLAVGAPPDADGREAERLTDVLEVGVYPLGKLAGGREERHHRRRPCPCGRTRALILAADDLDDGKDKSEGLAAAVRAADQVPTVQNGLKALRLDTV